MKRIIAAGLVALSLFVAAPVSAAQAERPRCHKVTVHMDDGTHQTIVVCLRVR
jgi:hypothetical protein